MTLRSFIATAFLLIVPTAKSEGIPIIVPKTSQIKTITYEELSSFYLFKRNAWHDSTPVVLVNFPFTHPVHEAFLRQHIGVGPAAYSRRFRNLVASGKTMQTLTATSMQEMLSIVGSTEGAIGYGDASFYFNSHGEVIEVELK